MDARYVQSQLFPQKIVVRQCAEFEFGVNHEFTKTLRHCIELSVDISLG